MGFDEEEDAAGDSVEEKGGSPEERVSATTPVRNGSKALARVPGLFVVLATGFGIGYSPFAAGTLGAALGFGIYCIPLAFGILKIALPLICLVLFGGALRSRVLSRKKSSGRRTAGKSLLMKSPASRRRCFSSRLRRQESWWLLPSTAPPTYSSLFRRGGLKGSAAAGA